MSKSLAEPIRFYKVAVALAIAALCSTSYAQNNTYQLTAEDMGVIEQSRQIMGGNVVVPGIDEDWMKQAMENAAKAQPQAQALMDELSKVTPLFSHAKKIDQAQKSAGANYSTLIFVSNSMGNAALNEVLAHASRNPDAGLVLRGIPEGMNIMHGVLHLQQMAAEYDPVPNIILDPSLFEKYTITAVPTIVALREMSKPAPTPQGEELKSWLTNPLNPDAEAPTLPEIVERVEVARVQGLYDPAWLNRNVEAGEKGDFGVRGPVQDIAERDLVEVMKERVLAIDWNQKREQAQGRYWQMQKFIQLPSSQADRTRLIDASVVATADIKTSTGEFVARAGDRVNPLQTRPFTQAIVVFDPTDKRQMELLSEKLPEIAREPGVARLIYIATQVDPEEGWDAYQNLTTELQAPVYLLTPDVASRFELQYTPSVITANETHFVVREWGPAEGKNDEAAH